MKSDDSMRVGAKFDVIRKMIGADSNTQNKYTIPGENNKRNKKNTSKN
jgi:hypothetical protein